MRLVICFHNQIVEPPLLPRLKLHLRFTRVNHYASYLRLKLLLLLLRLLLCSALAPSLSTNSGITSCGFQTGGGAAGVCSCCCSNGSCKSSSCSFPLVSNSTSFLQASTTIQFSSFSNCCCSCCSCDCSAMLSLPVFSGITSCDSHLATPASLSGI